MKKSKIVEIGVHIILWMIIMYFFTHYSYLRPSRLEVFYKEILTVVMIAVMVYLNYLFLIPQFLQKGKLSLYWSLSVCSILLVSLGEFFLFKPIVEKCYSSAIGTKEFDHYLITMFVMLNIRNLSFFMFSFLIRIYQDISKRYLLEKQIVSQKTQTISVVLSSKEAKLVNISDISYLSHNYNYTTLHLVSGSKLEQYISLKEMEAILPKGTFLRINKNCIVMLSQILDYDRHSVILKPIDDEGSKVLPISQKERGNLLLQLGRYIQKTIEDNSKNAGVNSKNAGVDNENMSKEGLCAGEKFFQNEEKKRNLDDLPLNDIAKKVLFFIIENPGTKLSAIAKSVQRSERTLERPLKSLTELGLVNFVGAPKFGGYYPVEQRIDD